MHLIGEFYLSLVEYFSLTIRSLILFSMPFRLTHSIYKENFQEIKHQDFIHWMYLYLKIIMEK